MHAQVSTWCLPATARRVAYSSRIHALLRHANHEVVGIEVPVLVQAEREGVVLPPGEMPRCLPSPPPFLSPRWRLA